MEMLARGGRTPAPQTAAAERIGAAGFQARRLSFSPLVRGLMLHDPGKRYLIDSANELQRRLLEELSEHIHRCELEAAETERAVLGDFTRGRRRG